MAEKRFEKTYEQGVLGTVQVWVDRETGVNYLYMTNGQTGGLTPLFRPRWETCNFSDLSLKYAAIIQGCLISCRLNPFGGERQGCRDQI